MSMLQEEQKGREAAEATLQEAQESFKAELAATRDKFRTNLASQTEAIQSAQAQLQVTAIALIFFPATASLPGQHIITVPPASMQLLNRRHGIARSEPWV